MLHWTTPRCRGWLLPTIGLGVPLTHSCLSPFLMPISEVKGVYRYQEAFHTIGEKIGKQCVSVRVHELFVACPEPSKYEQKVHVFVSLSEEDGSMIVYLIFIVRVDPSS